MCMYILCTLSSPLSFFPPLSLLHAFVTIWHGCKPFQIAQLQHLISLSLSLSLSLIYLLFIPPPLYIYIESPIKKRRRNTSRELSSSSSSKLNHHHLIKNHIPSPFAAAAASSGQVKPRRSKQAKTGLPLWMLGWGVDILRAEMNRLLALLFHQGVLDEQFLQLQQLQDESSPNFVSEVINIYFHESEKILRNLRFLLTEREFSDYKRMEIHLNQLMGSSSSIGAKRVTNVCVAFRAASDHNNRAGCLRALELLEHEYCYLKNKLHELFQIEQQRALASGVRYPARN